MGQIKYLCLVWHEHYPDPGQPGQLDSYLNWLLAPICWVGRSGFLLELGTQIYLARRPGFLIELASMSSLLGS